MIQPGEINPLDASVNDLTSVMHCVRAGVHGPEQRAWIALDLSMAQMKAMMVTLHHGAVTSRTLAQELHIGASAVTPLVDKLVKQKLVKREADPADRRVIWIKPTARAIALRERLSAANRSALRQLFDAISPQDVPRVQRALAILGQAARQRFPQPSHHASKDSA